MHPADLDVVERHVERPRVLELSVVGDDRDALGRGRSMAGLMASTSQGR